MQSRASAVLLCSLSSSFASSSSSSSTWRWIASAWTLSTTLCSVSAASIDWKNPQQLLANHNPTASSHPRAFFSTTTTTTDRTTSSATNATAFAPTTAPTPAPTMTSSDAETTSIWNGSDPDAFYARDHPGYTFESDPVTHTGGWWVHRAAETSNDWIAQEAALQMTKFDYASLPIGRPPRILVLYGSLRESSFSRKTAYEFARLLDTGLGCDVRVYNPRGLPVRDPTLEDHVKVQELRALTLWSDGHVWVSPEMHGTITGTFKNQIDWIPLNTGSVRPTQGRTCLVAQVNGGSQSFNAVNALRLLARWMRMPCCTNQSSIPKAWQEFDGDTGRLQASSFRDRVVDCAEEFAKFTAVLVPVAEDLVNRYSERKEKAQHEGRLLTQAEKEAQTTIQEARKG